MGPGSDLIAAYSDGVGLVNEEEGLILTGTGMDRLDTGVAGFFNDGIIDFGADNDTLLGFGGGAGVVKGGDGIDTLLLYQGSYTYSPLEGGMLTSSGIAMNITIHVSILEY